MRSFHYSVSRQAYIAAAVLALATVTPTAAMAQTIILDGWVGTDNLIHTKGTYAPTPYGVLAKIDDITTGSNGAWWTLSTASGVEYVWSPLTSGHVYRVTYKICTGFSGGQPIYRELTYATAAP